MSEIIPFKLPISKESLELRKTAQEDMDFFLAQCVKAYKSAQDGKSYKVIIDGIQIQITNNMLESKDCIQISTKSSPKPNCRFKKLNRLLNQIKRIFC